MTEPTRPVRRQLRAQDATDAPADAPAATPSPTPTAAPPPAANPYDEEPDPRLLWQWVGKAGRPWAGWGFIAVGLLITLIGWIGVSGEAIVAKQIPYVVSGGIGGVLLAVIGAYFLGTEELRKDSGRLDRLEQKVDELHAALLQRPDAPAPVTGPPGNGSSHEPESVLVVTGGETFHAHGCPMAAGKETEELAVAAAAKRGLSACPLCAPVPTAGP
jgi:hypothetical protein